VGERHRLFIRESTMNRPTIESQQEWLVAGNETEPPTSQSATIYPFLKWAGIRDVRAMLDPGSPPRCSWLIRDKLDQVTHRIKIPVVGVRFGLIQGMAGPCGDLGYEIRVKIFWINR